MAIFTLLVTLTLCLVARAYIPASPTNNTNTASAAGAGGINNTVPSKLQLQWYSNGSYSENVSYQLVGNGSTGVTRGAIVHFSEVDVNFRTPASLTPWIALVACDFNATNASQEIDVFSLAYYKGAISALLYSLYSEACIINAEYANASEFNQLIDIFSTQSHTSAQLIDYQFGQEGTSNESVYGVYDSQMLNDSVGIINASIEVGYPTAPGYLLATLVAFNATDQENTTNSGSAGSASSSGGEPSNTGTAMIILYAITGCVSALFCVVIISGAVRAIRHPERYGPRAGAGTDGYGPGQSRARGLTRAILDTFPIVKFGSTEEQASATQQQRVPDKDLEAPPDDESDPSTMVEMSRWETERSNEVHGDDETQPHVSEVMRSPNRQSRQYSYHYQPDSQPEASTSRPRSSSSDVYPENSKRTVRIARPPQPVSEQRDVVPAAIGRETCPICIVDFEEGDDLRLLPCEGKHRFHQQCVDPWLLELSSSCPICRQDFLALETMLSGQANGHHNPRASTAPHLNRFSRYLRFARHRRNGDQDDSFDANAPEGLGTPEAAA